MRGICKRKLRKIGNDIRKHTECERCHLKVDCSASKYFLMASVDTELFRCLTSFSCSTFASTLWKKTCCNLNRQFSRPLRDISCTTHAENGDEFFLQVLAMFWITVSFHFLAFETIVRDGQSGSSDEFSQCTVQCPWSFGAKTTSGKETHRPLSKFRRRCPGELPPPRKAWEAKPENSVLYTYRTGDRTVALVRGSSRSSVLLERKWEALFRTCPAKSTNLPSFDLLFTHMKACRHVDKWKSTDEIQNSFRELNEKYNRQP